ncbi:DcrB-related protein [Morganella morganii]|uniref:DcrB-related protein n=1 Tax=Morganella morganii TaxID=582 RepID=UPI001BDB0043|nr:DcrB-related protein [Morganella morganii]MBS5192642.1 DcrB-related protein [Morganella morganii]MBT0384012.1 DcrB-related protein [Morganella morganii subsp. morganii]
MNYICQEGSIVLPSSDYRDNSVHIIKFPEKKASLSLARDSLADRQTAEQYLVSQIAVIRKGVKLHAMTDPVAFTTESGVKGWSFYCEPEQKGIHLYQYIAGYELDSTILVMTYCQLHPFTDTDLQDWQTLKLRFTRTV